LGGKEHSTSSPVTGAGLLSLSASLSWRQLSASGMRVGCRWAVVNPSQQTRMQYGYVAGSGSSGSVTFSEAFSSAPIVVSQMINLITGICFVINVGSVTSTGFSFIKMYQQGGTTFNFGTEDWMWVANGA